MNHPEVSVWRKPLVALLATGDELVPPGTQMKPGQIIASNTFGLTEIVQSAGGKVLDLGIIADTMEALQQAIQSAMAQNADIIVTIGGASVGAG